MTNRPATKRSVDQLISRASLVGLLFALIETTAVITSAARHVGSPKSFLSAEAVRSTAIIRARPARTSLPFALSSTSSTSQSILLQRSSRNRKRRTKKIATIESRDGTQKSASHVPSGGIPVWKTTRFAGFEIGSTKLAAFAIKAQTNRYGSGETFALRTAVRIAGVKTTAVASFDMNMVTSVPTP